MEKRNSAKREFACSIPAGENVRIDSQKKKNNSDNMNDCTDSVTGKGTQGEKTMYTCPICLEVIVDITPRKPGHNSIYCDSECQSWIHHRCAGLLTLAFSNLCDSLNKKSFYYPNCHLEQQSLAISQLKYTLSKVVCELAELKENASTASSPSECSKSSIDASSSEEGPASNMPLLYSKVVSTGCSSTPLVAHLPQATRSYVRPHGINTVVDKKKINLFVYGIRECEKGMA